MLVKKVNGCKRHLIIAIIVHEANIQDRDGAGPMVLIIGFIDRFIHIIPVHQGHEIF